MNKVRIGIVGLGNIGKLHYSYMDKLEGAELSALCDVNPEKFKEITSGEEDFDHDVSSDSSLPEHISTFTNYKDMLDSGEVDLIIVSVPHYFHPEISIAAFKRGIHVICEKPVAITAREAREMNQAYQQSDVVFSAMFQKRTRAETNKIKQMIEDGTLGDIRRITWITTDMFRSQAYYNSGGWRGNWTGEGGGILMNQYPHDLDLFQWLFGKPVRVTSLSYLAKWHDITVEDEVNSLMEMENGAVATFICTTGEIPGTNRLEIAGENGKLVWEEDLLFHKLDKPVQEVLETVKNGFYSEEDEDIERIEIPEKPSGHRYITQNTVDVILGKKEQEELISPGTEGIKSVQIANSMLYSGLKGEQIEFPVAEDKFDQLLEDLREKELKNAPDMAFNWDEWIDSFKN